MADADIWMPIYWADYFADTLHLSTEQHGCYFLLMGHYWRKGPPPDDDGFLASVVKLSKDAWIKNREILAEFFQIKDGKWRHKRIESEKAEAVKNSRVYRRRGLAGAEARWNKDASSMQEALPLHGLKDAPSPSPSPKEQDKHAVEFKKHFDWTFPEGGGYAWSSGDFVQLSIWKKKYPSIDEKKFAEIAITCWSLGKFTPKTAMTIRGLCANWAQLCVKAKQAADESRAKRAKGGIGRPVI